MNILLGISWLVNFLCITVNSVFEYFLSCGLLKCSAVSIFCQMYASISSTSTSHRYVFLSYWSRTLSRMVHFTICLNKPFLLFYFNSFVYFTVIGAEVSTKKLYWTNKIYTWLHLLTSKTRFVAKLFKMKELLLHLFEVARHASSCLGAA